jgi:transcriptional regulator with XRE-family HTH domain
MWLVRHATLPNPAYQPQLSVGFGQPTAARVVGKYERDEILPSIDAAKKIAKLIDTTVGYLLGEVKDMDVFKDTAMLKRLNDITALKEDDKKHILFTIDHLLASVKTQAAYK